VSYDTLMVHVDQGIATITFNRPKALNAINRALLGEFAAVLGSVAADEDIRVLVLTGAGEKSFVAGADIGELAGFSALQAKTFAAEGHRVIARLQELPAAVIAAVNGFALGGGCEIALACDFIYAAETARFGLPEINLGLIPGFGGTQRLPRAIGPNRAKELLFTGRTIDAGEAARIGLVNKVWPAASLMEETLKTAREIAAKGRVALRAAKQAVNHGLYVDLATGCRIEIDAFALTLASADAREGTSAFLEKRKPTFAGRLTD
jgi:enoyl-CoA hydratase